MAGPAVAMSGVTLSPSSFLEDFFSLISDQGRKWVIMKISMDNFTLTHEEDSLFRDETRVTVGSAARSRKGPRPCGASTREHAEEALSSFPQQRAFAPQASSTATHRVTRTSSLPLT